MPEFPAVGKIHRLDSRLDGLIAADARVELLDVGFAWPEGPVWVAGAGHLLFSDIPRNCIYRWSEDGGASVWMQPSGYTGVAYYGKEPGSNGLTLDREGRLLACEHGDRRVSRLEHGGGKLTLVDSYRGKRLNSPNDLVLRSNGDLYFTDPAYGLHREYDDPARELPFGGVYLARPGEREPVLLTDELENPNGLAFSVDERLLYVTQSNSGKAFVMSYPVLADGTLGSGSVLIDLTEFTAEEDGLPDGLKVDGTGNIFTTGPGGVWVAAPDGALLGRVSTGERIANLCWGGDGSVLYLCSGDYLCRIATLTSGPLPGPQP
ncbi:MAG: SMP-30/gluconolactonase/LRE family protein [Bryobacterales bacterium]|nr:SMP-30/gluconolactonase/LRE family protein [Bryobacterales bacterium]